MNLDLPPAAVDFGREALRAFRSHGGVDLARRAIADSTTRQSVVAPILDRLGIDELLSTAQDTTSLLAAAELCRAAGQVALPYPVGARLAADADHRPVAVVDGRRARVDHGDLFDSWCALDLGGGCAAAIAGGPLLGTRLGTFVADMTLGTNEPCREDTLLPLSLSLACVTALGIAQRALELTVEHVKTRRQFGQPLASFQTVQFRLAQACTELAGLEELAQFTVVRLARRDPAVIVDALGLRMQTITVTREVMRTAHQMHGAIGFCDEHDLSMLTRCLQPFTRLPADLPVTVQHLLAAVDRFGFDATFDVAPAGEA